MPSLYERVVSKGGPRSGEPAGGIRLVLRNLAHLIGGKTAAGLMSLVYLVIVTHRLGVRDYGVLMLVNGYAIFIGSLVAFSGFHGLVRYGAIAVARGDREGAARLVRFMAVLELGFGLLAILVAAALVPLVGPRLGWSAQAMRMALPYSLAVLGTVRATPQGLLQLAGRFDLVGLHQGVSPVIRLIGALAIWFTGGGLVAFLSVWLVSSVLEGVAMWLLAIPAWRQLGLGRGLGPWRGALREGDGIGRFIVITNFDITLREFAPNLAPLTVGWLLGPAAAGLLALAQRATNLLQQPTLLLSNASYPVLAGHVARGEGEALRRTVWRAAALAGIAAFALVTGLAVFGGRLMTLIGGTTFAGGGALLILVALGRAAGMVAAPLAAGLTALGLPQRSMTIGLVANLGLYPALPALLVLAGLAGAGWHALVQNGFNALAIARAFARDSRSLRDHPPSGIPT